MIYEVVDQTKCLCYYYNGNLHELCFSERHHYKYMKSLCFQKVFQSLFSYAPPCVVNLSNFACYKPFWGGCDKQTNTQNPMFTKTGVRRRDISDIVQQLPSAFRSFAPEYTKH